MLASSSNTPLSFVTYNRPTQPVLSLLKQNPSVSPLRRPRENAAIIDNCIVYTSTQLEPNDLNDYHFCGGRYHKFKPGLRQTQEKKPRVDNSRPQSSLARPLRNTLQSCSTTSLITTTSAINVNNSGRNLLPSLSNYIPGVKYDIQEIESSTADFDDEVKQVTRKPSVPTRIVRPSSTALKKRPASVSSTRRLAAPKPIEEKKDIPIETPIVPVVEKQTLPPLVTTTTVEIDDV